MAEDDAKREARGVATNFLTLLAQVSLPAFHVQLARLLGEGNYGLYVLGNAFVDLVSVLTLFGMDLAIARRVSVAHRDGNAHEAARVTGAALRIVVATGLLAGAMLALGAPWIEAWQRKPGLAVALRFLAAVPVAYHAASMFLGATQAKMVMKYDLWARGLFQPLVLLALTSWLLRTGGGLAGACAAVATGMTLTCVFAASLYAREFAFGDTLRAALRDPFDRDLARVGLPLVLTNLVWTLQGRLEVFLLGRYGTAADTGAYGVCMLYIVSLSQVRGAFYPVLCATIPPALDRGDTAGLTAFLKRQTRWVAVLATPLAVLFAGFGDGLLAVFGRGYTRAAPALATLAVAHLWSALSLSAYVLPLGRFARYGAVAASLSALVQCVLLPTLVSRYGVLGAAMSSAIALSSSQALQAAIVWRVARVHGFSWGLAKVMLAAAAGFALGRATYQGLHLPLAARFFVSVGAAAVVYAVALVALRLEEDERALVRDAMGRARAMLTHALVRKVVGAVSLALAAVAYLPVLAWQWTRARSHGAFIGGIVPYSDAGDYFSGAERLLTDATLDPWNSRRPLNATLFAVRLALAGDNLRVALGLQAVLLGVATGLAARAIAADLGRLAGIAFFVATGVFGAMFAPTTLSESLGLSLGALSLAAFWHAARAPAPWRIAVGFLALTMALNARAGALFALPLALLWAARAFRGATMFAWRPALAGLGGIVSAFALNTLLLRVHHGTRGGAHGNFAYTLYGIARGGGGWQAVFDDYPVLRTVHEAERAAFIYARASERMRAHPIDVLRGLAHECGVFVDAWGDGLSLGLFEHSALGRRVVMVVAAAGVALAWRRARTKLGDDPVLGLLGAVGWGMLLSVPWIYGDGGERVFAATIPYLAALGVALVAASFRRAPPAAPTPDESVRRFVAPAAWIVALALAALVGPHLARSIAGRTLAGTPRCEAPATPVQGAFHGHMTHLRLVGDATPRSFAPTVRHGDFVAGVGRVPMFGENGAEASLRALPVGAVLALVYDPVAGRRRYIVGGAEVLSPSSAPRCVVPDAAPGSYLERVVALPAPRLSP